MKFSFKLMCLALLVSMIIPMAAACGNTSNEKNDETSSIETSSSSDETTTEEIRPNLPDTKYEKYDFKILVSGNTENGRKKNDFAAEEITGEPINDARYERNLAVQERFGIKIKNIEEYGNTSILGSPAGEKKLKNSVMAGDDSFDLAMLGGYACCNLAYNGYLYNIASLPYLDLTKSWWDQKANSDLMMNGKMFYTTGDISTADNDATQSILFSKSIVKSYDLDNPYEMVNDGSWTIDNFTRLGSSISADLNGDDKYDKNDRFGAIVWDDTMMGIYNACGEKCATINDQGKIELTFYNDRAVSMFEKFKTFAFDKKAAYCYQRTSYDITDPVNMFSNDKALFFMQLLDLVTYFRDMKNDFGILPYPKLDEAQENYYQTIGSWHSVFMCAPSDLSNPERTGAIIEALAYESLKTVTPAYYEKTLVGKYTRDEESGKMLDIILSSRVYDLGWYYQIGDYNEEIMNLLRKYNSDFTSMYESNKNKANALIDTINEAFSTVTA